MNFNFIPLSIEQAKVIETWRYDGFEKSIYMAPYFESYAKTGQLLGPGACAGFAAMHQAELSGLFEFYFKSSIMHIGLALNPKITGRGLGSSFVLQGINFGIEYFQYTFNYVELTVHPFNVSAIQCYLRAGFEILTTQEEEIKMRKMIS